MQTDNHQTESISRDMRKTRVHDWPAVISFDSLGNPHQQSVRGVRHQCFATSAASSLFPCVKEEHINLNNVKLTNVNQILQIKCVFKVMGGGNICCTVDIFWYFEAVVCQPESKN